jgi:hypothetical protein
MEGGTMNRNTTTIEGTEEAVCEGCSLIPVSHLGLDVDEPVGGWLAFFREENIEVATDDVGRLSVPRWVLGELLTEQREREARTAAQRAEQAATLEAPVPVGVPALDGASPFESLVAAGGVVTPEQEFGRRPRPNFLDEELAEGRRRDAERRAEAELLKHAQAVLEGRDK